MSVQDEITRIAAGKEDLLDAIAEQGIEVADNTTIEQTGDLVRAIGDKFYTKTESDSKYATKEEAETLETGIAKLNSLHKSKNFIPQEKYVFEPWTNYTNVVVNDDKTVTYKLGYTASNPWLRLRDNLQLEVGKTYTLSGFPKNSITSFGGNNGLALYFYDADNKNDFTIRVNNGESYTFVWKENWVCAKAIIYIPPEKLTEELTIAPMLNEGETAAPYNLLDLNIEEINSELDLVSSELDLVSKEAYLEWGGKNHAGKVGTVDAALGASFSANRIAYMNPAGITVEYSRDGGATWDDYGLTDAQKTKLTTTNLNTLECCIGKFESGSGEAVTTDWKLRITFDAQDGEVYFKLYKIMIDLSTQGASDPTMLVEKSTNGAPDEFTEMGSMTVNGWNGWNVYNGFCGQGSIICAFGGSLTSQLTQTKRVRLTFSIGSLSTSYTATVANALCVRSIYMYGDINWGSSAKQMAKDGHLYSYDEYQNATFPAGVKATQFTENGETLESKYATKTTVDDILDGSTVVPKANSDDAGNYIPETYATKEEVEEAKAYTDTKVQGLAYECYVDIEATAAAELAVENFKSDELRSLVLDMVYPVGSIYISVNQVSPANIIGGTWAALSAGYTLWTTTTDGEGGDTISAGLPNIIGSFYVKNTDVPNSILTGAEGAFSKTTTTESARVVCDRSSTQKTEKVLFNANSGSTVSGIYGKSSTVQPPAIKVYMWKRTA